MRRRIFFLLLISHFWVDFSIGIWPLYKTMLGIDLVKAGLISSIAGFIGDLGQGVFGFFGDRGKRKLILLFGLLASSSVFFVTLADHFIFLLLPMVAMMIGSGAFHPTAAGGASLLFPRRGRTLLLFTCGGTLGLGVSQLLFSKVMTWTGGSSLILLVPTLIMGGLWWFAPLPETHNEGKRFSVAQFLVPFREHRYSLTRLFTSTFLSYGVCLVLVFFLPDLLLAKGATGWLAHGGGHLLFIGGGFFGMILISQIGERMGWRMTVLGFLSMGMLAVFLFLLSPLQMAPSLLFAMGFCLITIGPSVLSWGNELVPESPSTVSALLMGVAWALSDLFTFGACLLARLFGETPFIPTMLCITPLLGLCFVLTRQVKPQHVQDAKSDANPL